MVTRSPYLDEDAYYDHEDEEPRELLEIMLDAPGSCTTCGKHGQQRGCFRCGKPVCYNEKDYLADTKCGGWILDSWHPAAPDDNEYYCQECLHD